MSPWRASTPRGPLPRHGFSRRCGLLPALASVLVVALLALPCGRAVAAAAPTIHVRIQGHIVYLSTARIEVRDRRGSVHVVLLSPTTTYWHKLERRAYQDLRMTMRVYVLGLPATGGAVTALKIHLYDAPVHHARAKKKPRATP